MLTLTELVEKLAGICFFETLISLFRLKSPGLEQKHSQLPPFGNFMSVIILF